MSELLNFLTLDNLKQTTGLMKESPLSISRWITMPFRWPWGSGRYKAIWKVRLMLDILLVKSHETRQGMCLPKHCWIQGRGPWGAAAPSLFQTKLRSEGSEKIFWRPGSPLISGSEWPGPPPYLKVWIRQCQRQFEFHEDEQIKHLQIQLAWFLVLVKVVWGGAGVKRPRIQRFYELFYSHPFLPSPPSQASVYLH